MRARGLKLLARLRICNSSRETTSGFNNPVGRAGNRAVDLLEPKDAFNIPVPRAQRAELKASTKLATAISSSCRLDNYLVLPDTSMDERIAAAKRALGEECVILGHHYQRDEVIRFADYTGDSYKLSKLAAQARGQLHRLLRRALHGRKRRRARPPRPAGDPARPERRLLHGRHGRNLAGGRLLGATGRDWA